MALTIGTGPFSQQPAGVFDVEPPARPLLFWEPFLKRLRVVVGGQTIADSRRVLALYETGEMMRLCVPWSDVRRAILEPGSIVTASRTGPIRSWSLQTAGGVEDAAARSFEAPPPTAAALQGHVFFDFDNLEAWYLEDDLGYAHPRDPYHRFDVHRSSHHVVARAGDIVVAETDVPAILFETSMAPRFYFSPDSVRSELLAKSETVSLCPYKGDGQHWHVDAGARRITDAGWSLTTPMGDALMIPRWFSFYPEKVTIEVDGRPLPS